MPSFPVAPCPFQPNFKFANQIADILRPANTREYKIYLNDTEEPIYRPYKNEIIYTDTRTGYPWNLKEISIEGLDGIQAAIGWVLHHDYQGAIPSGAKIRGLRARVGNIQVGNERIFSSIFPEERFCSWTVGEIHILDKRILPNGRRDEFEQNTHLSNVTAHLLPYTSKIARECRASSQLRNRIKEFNFGEQKVLEKIEI